MATTGYRYLHTTTKTPQQSASEMMQVLCLLGASNITMDYKDGEPSGMTFHVTMGNRVFSYRIPVKYDTIYAEMKKESDKKRSRIPYHEREKRAMEQAKRTAWRLSFDWLRVQCAFVQNGVRTAAEVFLADMVVPNGEGELSTVGVEFLKHQAFPSLQAPKGVQS